MRLWAGDGVTPLVLPDPTPAPEECDHANSTRHDCPDCGAEFVEPGEEVSDGA